MNNEELYRRLRETFQQELSDHVDSLTKELLAMESDQSPEEQADSWITIFRVAHTLKGASAIVNIDSIRDSCHAMEDVFGHYRDNELAMPEEMTSLMLKTIDGFSEISSQMQSGQEVDESVLADTLPEMRRHAEEVRQLKRASAEVPDDDFDFDLDEPASIDDPPVMELAESFDPQPNSPKVLATSATTPAPNVAAASVSASVRVTAQKLDSLLSHSGELLIARGRMALRKKDAAELADSASALRSQWQTRLQGLRDVKPQLAGSNLDAQFLQETGQQIAALTKGLDALATGMESDDRLLNQTCSRLDDEVYHVRMLPFSDVCVGLERIVRDVARASGKSVRFQIDGGDVEVDRSVLEGLKDPLLHLIRNAVDHGIESPADRIAAGKPEQATVTVSASLRGGQVEVLVEDDGRGFDLEEICAVAKKRGLQIPDDPRQQARLVLRPGFSTATMITDISGRGVGMDVVQSRVESLHGELNITFEARKSTTITMHVPLTLTTIRCMLVRTAGQQFAIPTAAINRLAHFTPANIRPIAGRDTLFSQDNAIPLVPLADSLGLKAKSSRSRDSDNLVALVLSADQRQVAVVVDEVVSEQEALVKNLGKRIDRLRHFSGCTLLPSGRLALVINAANVVRSALETRTGASVIQSTTQQQQQRLSIRILLVDDSVTTRILLKNILETAGYAVVDATDGQQALELLKQNSSDDDRAFDAVVSDVDMPRMNGFQLTSQIRGYEPSAEIPVVLVTARGSDEDKKQGIMVGASAYIIKGSFDQQNLLKTLSQLV